MSDHLSLMLFWAFPPFFTAVDEVKIHIFEGLGGIYLFKCGKLLKGLETPFLQVSDIQIKVEMMEDGEGSTTEIFKRNLKYL